MGWCWGRKYSPGLRSIRSWKNEGRLATIEQHKFFIAEGHSSMTVRNTRCRVRLCDPSHQGTLPDIYQTPWPNGTVGRRRGIFKAKEINLRIFSLLSRVSQALGSRHWQCCVRQFPNFFQTFEVQLLLRATTANGGTGEGGAQVGPWTKKF